MPEQQRGMHSENLSLCTQSASGTVLDIAGHSKMKTLWYSTSGVSKNNCDKITDG